MKMLKYFVPITLDYFLTIATILALIPADKTSFPITFWPVGVVAIFALLTVFTISSIVSLNLYKLSLKFVIVSHIVFILGFLILPIFTSFVAFTPPEEPFWLR